MHDLEKVATESAPGTDAKDSSTSLCQIVGEVLTNWPTEIIKMLTRLEDTHSSQEVLQIVLDREGSILSRTRRGDANRGGVFEFLADAVFQFLDTSPRKYRVDPRHRIGMGRSETNRLVDRVEAARRTGMDSRAITSLIERGIFKATKIGPGRILLDYDSVTAEVVESWSNIGIREASAILEIPVDTVLACQAQGLITLANFQSAKKGFSKKSVVDLKDRLLKLAQITTVTAPTGEVHLTLGDIWKSSKYTTAAKVELVRHLLEGRLRAVGKSGTSYLELVIELDRVEAGMRYDIRRPGYLFAGDVAEVLRCRLHAIRELVRAGYLESESDSRFLLVQRQSLDKFRNKYIFAAEIAQSLGVGYNRVTSKLPKVCKKAPPIYLAERAGVIFAKKHLPTLEQLASMMFVD